MWDDLWINGKLATMRSGEASYGAIEDGVIAAAEGRIAWVGARKDLPGRAEGLARNVHNLAGHWLTPGLIDCHTHIVFGGNRAREFELRLQGASYEEIARAGGGIRSTVMHTRKASEEQLLKDAQARVDCFRQEGVTTIEVKSGYGLDRENEAKMLRVARRLASVTVRTSFLGAHALPPEYEGRSAAYIDLVVEEMLPAVTGLADAVDAFCERIAFSPQETRQVFTAARAHGLPVKLHADQLSDLSGAALAAEFSALSADHLEYTSEAGVEAMARSGTVAVLLPGAFYFLREKQLPPIEALRRAPVPIAIASDCNPGSSPVTSLLLMLNMAATLFRLTPEEALAGITRSAAAALGLGASHGTLEPGKVADFAIFAVDQPAELSYRIGANPCVGRVVGGQPDKAFQPAVAPTSR
jgi:imidazolonepropionase